MEETFSSADGRKAASGSSRLSPRNKVPSSLFSLSYSRRLHYPREYRRFFGESEVFRLRHCVVFRVKNDLDHFRLGITLKARGTSLERNRVKRQIRESFRLFPARLGAYDYNVVIPGSKKLSFPFHQQIGQSLKEEIPRVFTPDSNH